MTKIQAGLVFGVIAGVIDVIPMVIQKLTWDANLSAFSMWVVVGFLVATTELRVNAFKGALLAFLVLLPLAILIGWREPMSLIPIGIMTLILGSGLGFAVGWFGS